jgi:hypothetical protein
MEMYIRKYKNSKLYVLVLPKRMDGTSDEVIALRRSDFFYLQKIGIERRVDR